MFFGAKTVTDVMTQRSQYSGLYDNNYNEAMLYLNNRDGGNKKIEDVISVVLPIYNGTIDTITDGAQWYYSPQSMVPIGSVPPFAVDSRYKEVLIEGVDKNIMRVYKK